MKRLFSSLVLFFSFTLAFAQSFSAVVEYRHDDAPDKRLGEVQSIVRYMTSPVVGFSTVGRVNDTSSNIMAGVTCMPASWIRLDILAGSRIEYGNQWSVFGLRFWTGNAVQNFWFNIDGGAAPVWFEGIYMLSLVPWLDIGAMAQTFGAGPRVDLNVPVFTNGGFKVWGAVIGNWFSTAAGAENFNPQNLHALIGVKAIF